MSAGETQEQTGTDAGSYAKELAASYAANKERQDGEGSLATEPPDTVDDPDDDENEDEEAHEDARTQGQRIAAMVEDEAERVEQEEATPLTVQSAPPPDPYTRTCPTCEGYGQTLTGSIVDTQEFRECVDCHGKGWQERLEPEPQPGVSPPLIPESRDAWRWQ